MANPGDLAFTVKQQADIVRVVGDYIKLKKSGAQNFSGLCPFHQEKTPSFYVHVARQWFHCFGCGASGDVFSFVQKIENISFMEAVRLVAEKLDIKMPKMQYSSEHEAQDARQRGQILEMHERAGKFFEDQLRRPEAAYARQYLAGRGLSEETIGAFRIGYAPDSGFLLKDRFQGDYSEELLRASGLFSWKEGAEAGGIYSKFRNRITFPIAQENGKIIAFTGRTLATDDKSGPKYLNSPETPVYSKSRVLYNLDKAKDAIRHLKYTILVEGQMDCISVYAAGFHNVVASSGTAFTETQARLLGRFSKDIVVNFDPDTAGAAATDRSLALLLSEEFKIKILRLEEGFDPDLFIRTRGVEAYTQALFSAPNFFDYLFDRAVRTFPVKSPEGKKNAVNYLLPYVQRLPSRIERDGLANDMAQKLGVDSSVLRMEFRAAAARRSTSTVGAKAAPGEQITLAEKILVRAASSPGRNDEEAKLRRQALATLATERLHEGLGVESLLETILNGTASPDGAGQPFHAMSLPLSDGDRALLARIIMREDEPLTTELLDGAFEALRRRRQIHQRERDIMRGLAEAERANDATAMLRLKQEKLELDRKLSGDGGS